MNDLVQTLGLGDQLTAAGVEWRGVNFEQLYDRIARDVELEDVKAFVEREIESYFESLELPETPTLFDFLLLSLRGKDVVATFNWDPFLIQTYRRNVGHVPTLPRLLFLHGNVLSGYCAADRVYGVRRARCTRCGNEFSPTRLLFPVAQKDYASSPGIAAAWSDMEQVMKRALFVTIFGYGAPASDAAAIDLLSNGWGPKERRRFEEFEIIDIRDEDEVRAAWKRFIHTHHYQVTDSFFSSWIGNHPRRSIEAFMNQYIEAQFIDDNPLPCEANSLDAVWDWFSELSSFETEAP